MKRILMAAAAAALAFAAAAPASAQPYGDHDRNYGDHDRGDQYRGDHHDDHGQGGGWDIGRRLDWLQERINHARQDGDLSWRDAQRIQYRLDGVRGEYRRDRYRDGGRLSDRDRDELNGDLDRLAQSIRWARNGDQYRLPWLGMMGR